MQFQNSSSFSPLCESLLRKSRIKQNQSIKEERRRDSKNGRREQRFDKTPLEELKPIKS